MRLSGSKLIVANLARANHRTLNPCKGSCFLHPAPLRAVRPLNLIVGDHAERVPRSRATQRNWARQVGVADKAIIALEVDLVATLDDREALTRFARRGQRL